MGTPGPWLAATGLVLMSVAVQPRAQEPAPPPAGIEVPLQGELAYGLRFGGQDRLVAQVTNFDRHPLFVSADQGSVSFAALRLRHWINLFHEQRRDHGLYAQIEIGHVFAGEDREFPKTFDAGGDEVGVELRRGYLWAVPFEDSVLRAGVVDWHDRFGDRPVFDPQLWAIDDYSGARSVLANSVWDFDVAGVTLEGRLADSTHYRTGLLWLAEGDDTLTGTGAAWLATADLDLEVGDDVLGASIYYLRDNGDYSYGTFGGPMAAYDSSQDLWVGLRAYLDWGSVLPSAWVIYNRGETDRPDWRHQGWAARLAVDVPVRESTISAQVLYASGDDGSSATRSDEFRTIAQSERDNFGAQGYWSYMALSSPHGPTDVDDLGVGLQNRGLGLLTLQVNAAFPLAPQWSGRVAAAWLRAAESRPANGDSDLGIELLAELRWEIAEAFVMEFGGAWLGTGDFYRDPLLGAPDDLFSLFARWQLEF